MQLKDNQTKWELLDRIYPYMSKIWRLARGLDRSENFQSNLPLCKQKRVQKRNSKPTSKSDNKWIIKYSGTTMMQNSVDGKLNLFIQKRKTCFSMQSNHDVL